MKKIIIVITTLILIISLSACAQDVQFELLGDEEVYLTTNAPYSEHGYIARDDYEDLSEYVTIEGNVDPYKSGDYTVTYTLDYKGETTVLERTIYYREEGCTVVPETNLTKCVSYWSQYLNTAVKLTAYYEDDRYHDKMDNIFNNLEYILSDYHRLTTKYDAYDGVTNVYAINQNPTTTHTIDPRLFDLIQFSLDHQDDVNNLFNIALGPVLAIWHDYRDDCTLFVNPVCGVPDMADLQAANQYTDPSDIVLDEENLTITMADNMSIDLGGVSKGYISGEMIEYLESLDLYGYILNNGTSNISVGGSHPTRENGKYLLAVTDPTFDTDYYATVYLGDGDQLVTSGDYQQYFIYNNELYHHIINPLTLMPERYSRSVSIATSDPALADLYSTAIFTMSIEDGLDFVNGIEDLEAIWFTLDNTIVMSDNFESMYLNEAYYSVEE